MSVRTEPRDVAKDLQATLTISPQQIEAATLAAAGGNADLSSIAGGPEQHLHGANNFHNTSPDAKCPHATPHTPCRPRTPHPVPAADHPLKRNVVINIRASLSDLCMKADRAEWKPDPSVVRSIFQQAHPSFQHASSSSACCNQPAPPPLGMSAWHVGRSWRMPGCRLGASPFSHADKVRPVKSCTISHIVKCTAAIACTLSR